ncbi:MAG TPA: GNAT family N-acetyltransferase [Aggregatilineaceae bacterium]|nr:GNAT family N-acetyltransferase [Aggregatilineaceae bacterium]
MPGKIVFEGQTTKGLSVYLRYPTFDDLHALWEYINTLSQERTFLLVQGETISYDDETTWLKNQIEQIAHKQEVMIAALHGATLIGNTAIGLGRGVKRHVGTFGISVARDYRGQGVGELLARTVIDEAVAQLPGLQLIELEVFGNNPIAMSLYRKVGFVEYGRIPGGILHHGEPVDAVYMYRPARLERHS